MDIRNLRLSIEKKLKERRSFMAQARQAEREKEFVVDCVKSRVFNYAIDDCADEIIKAVLDEALKASRIVASESVDGQIIEVGVNIPSLCIRRAFYKEDMALERKYGVSPLDEPIRVKRLHINTSKQ